MFAQVARKEESDFFFSLKKLIKGSAYAMVSAPPILSDLAARLSLRARNYVHDGIFGGDEDEGPSELGDRLTEYEMVEDLIERGMLAENEDGTLHLQLM